MKSMNVTVIMPVFNEQATVSKAVHQVLAISAVKQLIIVDDASTDDSLKTIKKIKDKKIIVLTHIKNKGKGGCIQTALSFVTGDLVIINDADLEYDPNDYEKLLLPIKLGKAEVVYGSRFKGPHTNMFFWHYVGNQFLNFLINILYNTTLSDMESCYKVIPTKILKSLQLTAKRFDFEPEVTCKILKRKIRIYEVPISYSGRGYEQGKKMHWTQGLAACQMILKERFS